MYNSRLVDLEVVQVEEYWTVRAHYPNSTVQKNFRNREIAESIAALLRKGIADWELE